MNASLRDRAAERIQISAAHLDALIARRKATEPQPLDTSKRLPPFGKALKQLRLNGLVPQQTGFGHVVVTVDSWRWGQQWLTRLVIPVDAHPDNLDFSPAAGLNVTIAHSQLITTLGRRDSVIRALLKVGPTSLFVFDVGIGSGFFVKSISRGIEKPEYADA